MLLKDKPLSRALRCLHEAEERLTASTQLLDTLEKRVALTAIVADLETLRTPVQATYKKTLHALLTFTQARIINLNDCSQEHDSPRFRRHRFEPIRR